MFIGFGVFELNGLLFHYLFLHEEAHIILLHFQSMKHKSIECNTTKKTFIEHEFLLCSM